MSEASAATQHAPDPRDHARHVAVATFDRLRHGHSVSDALHGAFDAFEQVLMTAGILTAPDAPPRPFTVEEIEATARWLANSANHPRTKMDGAWQALMSSPEAVDFAVAQAMRRANEIPGGMAEIIAAKHVLAAHQQGR